MQFLVISDPVPARPSDVRGHQTRFWDWLQEQKDAGRAKQCFVKTGRGAIVIFDVEDHNTLHRMMTEWSDCVPAAFTVYPLIDQAHQEQIARLGANAKP